MSAVSASAGCATLVADAAVDGACVGLGGAAGTVASATCARSLEGFVAVGVSSIRGGGRVRPSVGAVETSDPNRLPVIEELGTGPVRRRD